MLPRTAFLIAALLCAGCGASSRLRPAPWMHDLYEANAMVLESREHGPELCVGAILLPDPPVCGGPPLAGWSWDDVPGESTRDGTTSGEYHVVGAYDGEIFTVLDTGPWQDDEAETDPVHSPCARPSSGWEVPDPKRASEWDADRADRLAEKDEDFAGIWQGYYGGGEVILYVAFTGGLERHERELRRKWGGALCLVERDLTYEELDAIREELSETAARDFGLDVLSSYVDVSEGTAWIDVTSIDDATRAELYERFPEGVVEVEAQLTPVE